ncbi:TonB family protein [Hymenobacter gummosus]|uniref:TonB family protein n=1 Tax=Hymenobacter gummosus TaxID=1776032 RepID=A0A431U8Q1_9BACT|nr:TonB family protein [Hymenobacter gummosus]RTQ53684.1 TonB family protein [Hymenobacter gummosus]
MPTAIRLSPRGLLLGGLLLSLAGPVAAQQKPAAKPATPKPAATPPRIYESYELQTPPEYAEGRFALQQYLKTQLQLPADVKENRVRGSVTVAAVVQPDGRLTDAYILRGLSPECNAEALRLMKAMPRWRPARRNDEAVAARIQQSIAFEPPRPATDHAEAQAGGRVVEEVVESKVYTYVEQMPQPIGGMDYLTQYINASLRYPAEAVQKQVEGKVFVNFVVGPQGQISNAKVTKGIGAGCDEEAVRVISQMPAWAPGKQNGRAVSVSYTLPVTFSLQSTPGAPGAATPPLPTLPKPEDKIYTYVEQMPAVAGAPQTTIAAALQAAVVLPKEVTQGGQSGRVYLSFVVSREGKAEDAKIIRPLCPACDAAALAAVERLPLLTPGRQNGQPVRVQLTQTLQLYGPNHVFELREAATPAAFTGGPTALRQYLTDKLREPEVLKKENLRGVVEVRFVVQADGKVGAAEVLRPLCRSCDDEALRLVRAMPAWQPARNAAGQPIAVRQSVVVTMPVAENARKADTQN